MRLLNDRVLVKPNEDEENVTGSGLIIASTSQLLAKGKVVAVGHGLLTQAGERVPLTVAEGDEVLYSAAVGIDYEGARLISESDIVGIL